MRVGLFTREYPPHVYGGAGVHVEYLSRELARQASVEVHCWGKQHSDDGNLHAARSPGARSPTAQRKNSRARWKPCP
jgi:hypothetical protein